MQSFEINVKMSGFCINR